MTELKKTLGLPSLMFYGIGMILGAGIYSVLGPAASLAQDAIWMSFLIAAFVALLTGLSYAELATRIPEAGAEYSYLQKALPNRRLISFVVGLVVCVLGAATAATVSLSFAGYLQGFIKLPIVPTAFGLLLLVTLINIIGLQISSKVNILFTLIELGGLAIVITLGLQSEEFASDLSITANSGVLPATALLFFSYLGFENMAALAEEAKDAKRHIPIAIIASVILTTVVYVLVGLATIALVPPEQLLGDEAPLVKVVAAGSNRMVPVIQGIALFATANTALIAILSASRVLFTMGRKKDLPDALTKLASKKGSPWIATLAVFAVAACMLPLGSVEVVAKLASFISLLVFATVHIALIILRFDGSPKSDTFRVPLSIGRLPLIPCVGILAIMFMMVQFNGQVYGLSAGVIFMAFAVYLVLERKRNKI